MASKEAIAIKCNAAMERIEAWVKANVNEGLTPLPRLHRDREILRKLQLEGIADWLDRAQESVDPRLEQAIALLDSGNWTKADMEAVLRGGADESEGADDVDNNDESEGADDGND